MAKRKNTGKPLQRGPNSTQGEKITQGQDAHYSQHEVSVEYRGPLPHPSDLNNYEIVVPGSAQVIIDRGGVVQDHILSIEGIKITHTIKHETRGQYMAFILAILGIGCGTYTAAIGHGWAGGGLGIIGVSAILSQFLQRYKK